MKKKKTAVSPEAARILEQYRNAGKPQPATTDAEGGTMTGGPSKPSGNNPPPPTAKVQRSGNRGK